MRGLFITGTDTGVGKTYVACGMIAALWASGVRVGAYKPVVSGSITGPGGPVWEDLVQLQSALGGDVPIESALVRSGFRLRWPPLWPRGSKGNRSMRACCAAVSSWWCGQADVVVVEGAGGLLSPISATESVADLAVSFGFPLVIVVRGRSGRLTTRC